MPVLAAGFVFGSMIGSFLNVCIFRLPAGESIVWPGSHCQACKKPIAWYDNIPILSYFILKGRCRNCRTRISPQYAAVEFITGLLFILFLALFGLSFKSAIYLVFTLALLVVTAIDWRHQIIPDEISLPGIIVGVALSAVFPEMHGAHFWAYGLRESLIGVLVGGGFLFALGTLAEKILKKEAMGGGDVKLLAMIGAFIGWPGVLWTVFVSSLLGSVVGVIAMMKNGSRYIPYGPYLAFAAVLYVVTGDAVIAWYLKMIGMNF
jgi:leader peptidase (prepilin peptidase) / N-methyltransferase